MTRICVVLYGATTEAILDRMAELAQADLFEVRADLTADLDQLAVLRAKTKPVIFTCRGRSEGGAMDDDDPRRHDALREAVRRGFDYVDVEHSSGFHDVMVAKSGRGLIVSRHDLEGTPDDLPGLYAAMAECGADIVKLVVTPRSVADVGRLLECASAAARGGGPPLVALALGPLGVASRVLAGRSGAPFTFAAAETGAETALGQLPLASLSDLYRVRCVGPGTRVYGVLGSDVARSLSPAIHNRAFAECGIDAVYVPLAAEALPPFLRALPALGLSGFSVTRPYKVEILAHLHEVEEAAALSGSVNTVLVRDGRLQGSTTDGLGVVAPLKRRIALRGVTAVVLGGGGAARAAALALVRKRAQVTVLARDPAQSAAVGRAVGCSFGSLDDLGFQEWDVLVNATPVGSASAPDATPVPAEQLRPGRVVLDMVYDPPETRLLREAREAGCTVIDGREMLVAQAAAQFETWTGLEAPLAVMRAAAGVEAAA
jgi:3-dehydroquinate dehydratase/shikimate dehydrogenase